MPFCNDLEGQRKCNKLKQFRASLKHQKNAPKNVPDNRPGKPPQGSAPAKTMADYIYLLETRLSKPQRDALQAVRDAARARTLTLFLVGGAVRDLISGAPVRDLDIAIQGNALDLLKDIQATGAVITGKLDLAQAFFATFPGGVRMEVGSTLSVTYPRPGKPEVQPAPILDDLRRRDFTANSMALSLNEGSFGLLMDPLNGVADIENRDLRLVSNYGFIEDPVRMIRAARLMARLGWRMDEKTEARYQTGREENYIAALSNFHRGYETEELLYEEDPLRVMRRLEEEGWLKHLAPALSVSKANLAELDKLREIQIQLQTQGVHTDGAAAFFPLLTAKLSETELSSLKKSFARSGFVAQIENLDAAAKRFVAELTSKAAALPSQAYKMIVGADPETVLWAAYISKSVAFQAKLKSFYTDWPAARQKIPYTLMLEMRITPETPRYAELIEQLFFELMDGRLQTPEEIKAFLEPFSPPAPPPTVHLRRQRAAKKGAKSAKGRKKSASDSDSDSASEDMDEEDSPPAVAADDDDEEEDADQDELTPDPIPSTQTSALSPDFTREPAADLDLDEQDEQDNPDDLDETAEKSSPTDPDPLPPAPTPNPPAAAEQTPPELPNSETPAAAPKSGPKQKIAAKSVPPRQVPLTPAPPQPTPSQKEEPKPVKPKAPEAAAKPTSSKIALSAPAKRPGPTPVPAKSVKPIPNLPRRSQPATKAAPPPRSNAPQKAPAKPAKSAPQKSAPTKAAPAKSPAKPTAKPQTKSKTAANLKASAKPTSPAKPTATSAKGSQAKGSQAKSPQLKAPKASPKKPR